MGREGQVAAAGSCSLTAVGVYSGLAGTGILQAAAPIGPVHVRLNSGSVCVYGMQKFSPSGPNEKEVAMGDYVRDLLLSQVRPPPTWLTGGRQQPPTEHACLVP